MQVLGVSLLMTEVESEGEDTNTLADLVEPAATPGRTVLVKHTVWLKDKVPARRRSYQVLQHLVAILLEAVKEMQRLQVIKPLDSK